MGNWNDTTNNTHQSHEIRLSTNEDYRFRGLVGGYWEEFKIYDQMNFNYLSIPQCNAANLASALTPTVRTAYRPSDPFPAPMRPIPACARIPARRSART